MINDESITQLESENKELKEKVSLIEDFEKMKKDFEKLKNDYNTEQIRYDTKVREVGDKQKN